MLFIIRFSSQQWNELSDRVKTDFFQINPEQLKAVFSTYDLLNEQDMIGHYIGSLNRAKAGEILKKVRMLDEIYTPNIRVKNPYMVTIKEDMKWPAGQMMFIKKDVPINTAKNSINIIKSVRYKEPIGGGGGGGGSAIQQPIKHHIQDYTGFKGKLGFKNVEQWEQVLKLEKALGHSPNLWVIKIKRETPDNSAFYRN